VLPLPLQLKGEAMTTLQITTPDWHTNDGEHDPNVRSVFVSDVIVSAGYEQEIEHGLGRVPKLVFAFAVDLTMSPGYASYVITEGVHDDVVCRFYVQGSTVNGFRVVAIA
jgi:hypothetical protein